MTEMEMWLGKDFYNKTITKIAERYKINIKPFDNTHIIIRQILHNELKDTIDNMRVSEDEKDEIYNSIIPESNMIFDIAMLCFMELGAYIYKRKPSKKITVPEGFQLYQTRESDKRNVDDYKIIFKMRGIEDTSGWCQEFRDVSFKYYQVFIPLANGDPFDSRKRDRERYSFRISSSIYNMICKSKVENRILFEQIIGYALTQLFFDKFMDLPSKFGDGRVLMEKEGKMTDYVINMSCFAAIPYFETRLILTQVYLKSFPKTKTAVWEPLLKRLEDFDLRNDLMSVFLLGVNDDYNDAALDKLLNDFRGKIKKEYEHSQLNIVSSNAEKRRVKYFMEENKRYYIPSPTEMYYEVCCSDVGKMIMMPDLLWDDIINNRYERIFNIWKRKNNIDMGNMAYIDALEEQKQYYNENKNKHEKISYNTTLELDYKIKYALLHAVIMDKSMRLAQIIP